MQTFVPCVIPTDPIESFRFSARVLDRQRLGKQRVETFQILNTLNGVSAGWRNHPAVRMWRGYANALAVYGQCMCEEWIARGYKDTCLTRFSHVDRATVTEWPAWLNNPAFAASHRANLLRKYPEWYGQFGWTDDPSLPYVWPV